MKAHPPLLTRAVAGTVACVALIVVVSCAGAPPMEIKKKALSDSPPILFIHGINDTHRKWMPVLERVLAEGAGSIRAIDYTPADGSMSILELADQLDDEVERLLADTGVPQIDLVGFSLGTQIVRYWMFRRGGKAKVRRFVAISGPFAGTEWAHLGLGPVATELAPGSAFLHDLENERYAPVDVTAIYTPLDGVIVPASSSRIEEATNIEISVALHPRMYGDTRVHDAIVHALAKEAK